MSKSLRNWIIVLAIGFVIWVCPTPQGLTPNAWHLFAVFAATIAGFILQPISMGAVAFIALTFCAITGVLKTGQALMGFGNGTIWLIVCAFFLSRAFIKTGFGRRIAFLIIKYIGRSSLTLGYSIALSELIVSPAMPSATARGGGVFYPIVQSLRMPSVLSPGPQPAKSVSTSCRSVITLTRDLHNVPDIYGRQPAVRRLGCYRCRCRNYMDELGSCRYRSGFDQLVPGSGSDAQTFSS